MDIRKATEKDIDAVADIYTKIHEAEARGEVTTGWQRGIYPIRDTARNAVDRGDLFVLEENGRILGSEILNHLQVDVYADAKWEHEAPDDKVMVMHTLTIDPDERGKGYGRAMELYYEQYAVRNGCYFLRIDTNAKNTIAREFYNKLGYKEICIVPCEFNGIEGVKLVLLEKCLI